MGKGADRKRKNNANRRARGETWSEIQGQRHGGAAAAWAPATAAAEVAPAAAAEVAAAAEAAQQAASVVMTALPSLSAGLLAVEAERQMAQCAGPSVQQVDGGGGGGGGVGAEPPNAGRCGEEYAVAWLRHTHAGATVRWLNDVNEQHADHDIEIQAEGEAEWRHVEVKTRWSGCDPRMNEMSDRQRKRLLNPKDSYMLLVVGDAHKLFATPASAPRVRLYEPAPTYMEEPRRVKLPAPKVAPHGFRAGETILLNFVEICSGLKREPEDFLSYLLAELDPRQLGENGLVKPNGQTRMSLDQIGDFSRGLILNGRLTQTCIEGVIRRYVRDYITCKLCGSCETVLNKSPARLELLERGTQTEHPTFPWMRIYKPASFSALEREPVIVECQSCTERRAVAEVKTAGAEVRQQQIKLRYQLQIAAKGVSVEGVPFPGYDGVYLVVGEHEGWPRYENSMGKHLYRAADVHNKALYWVLGSKFDPGDVSTIVARLCNGAENQGLIPITSAVLSPSFRSGGDWPPETWWEVVDDKFRLYKDSSPRTSSSVARRRPVGQWDTWSNSSTRALAVVLLATDEDVRDEMERMRLKCMEDEQEKVSARGDERAAQRQLSEYKAVHVEGMPQAYNGMYVLAGEHQGWPRFENSVGKHLYRSIDFATWMLRDTFDPAGPDHFTTTDPLAFDVDDPSDLLRKAQDCRPRALTSYAKSNEWMVSIREPQYGRGPNEPRYRRERVQLKVTLLGAEEALQLQTEQLRAAREEYRLQKRSAEFVQASLQSPKRAKTQAAGPDGGTASGRLAASAEFNQALSGRASTDQSKFASLVDAFQHLETFTIDPSPFEFGEPPPVCGCHVVWVAGCEGCRGSFDSGVDLDEI